MIKQRIKLVPLDLEYTSNIIKWRNDPNITKYLFNSESITVESHLMWFKEYKRSDIRKEFVILEVAGNKPIGTIGLDRIDRKNLKAELSIILGESEYLGKGYGKEALILLLDYAFRILELNKVFLKVFNFNQRAVNMYSKVGFSVEGILREHIYKNGVFNDVLEMSLLKREWKIQTCEMSYSE